MRATRSLKRRLVLAATGAVVVMLVVFMVVFNVVLDHRLSDDAHSVVESRVQAGLAVVNVEPGGKLAVEETPHDDALDERVWIFERGRAIERAHAPASVQAAVNRLAGTPRVTSREAGSQLLLAHPIVDRGTRVGTVIATVSLLPYRHSKDIVLVASLLLSLLTIAVLAVVARALIGRALRPVAQMTAQASDWSEHDLNRRFALG
ncbi:MAG: hypothetical protein QOJ57_2876, partial [Thermoleophilaceae bacterium]|nr:hypothetical protein [Thermoleophilaceae bacterium]